MKLRTIVKIAITSSVVLLCSGFALYSFFRLSAAEGRKDFNLYELVPSTTSAVFVTDDVLEFVAEVDDLTCSKNQQYIYVSKLFSYLKQSLYALSEDTPHGLSRASIAHNIRSLSQKHQGVVLPDDESLAGISYPPSPSPNRYLPHRYQLSLLYAQSELLPHAEFYQ